MKERAAHLVDHVLPRVPVRQWVLSLPFELRYRLAWDHALCGAVLAVYTLALLGFYRKRAKASGHRDGRAGTVTVIQRFGGALNLNVHFHTLALDGVFVREPDGSLRFVSAEAPTDEEVEALLGLIRKRVLRLLVRRGLLSEELDADLCESQTPPLHALYAASVRQRVAMGRRAGAPVLRLGEASTVTAARPKRRRQARLGGFDLHANTSVRAKNRPKLERLCRYLLRPPVAEDRLSLAPDGTVLLRLKTLWHDGTSHIAVQPLELLEKLAALIPRPYVNLIVYHGVLAPNAKWRREVVDFGRATVASQSSASSRRKVAGSSNRTWAELMRRGLDIDVLQCPDCGGRLRFVAAIMLSSAIRRILRHHGLPSDPVELAPARALERELGLTPLRSRARERERERVPQRAADCEAHHGVDSFARWAREKLRPVLQTTELRSWDEVHAICGRYGVAIRPHSNGLVFENADRGVRVKASFVARELSKTRLCEQLGAFQPASERQREVAHQAPHRYSPMPARSPQSL